MPSGIAEDRGDLRDRRVPQVTQRQEHPVVGREPVERAAQQPPLDDPLQLAVRCRGGHVQLDHPAAAPGDRASPSG